MQQLTMNDLKKANPKESTFETSMVKKIKAMFPSCYEVPKPIMPSSRGTPDRLFLINGKFIALETKRAKNSKTAKAQLDRLNAIKCAGGYGGIVKTFDEVTAILSEAGLI